MKEELINYQNNSEDRLIRSFGRIKSRKLSDNKNFLLEDILPQYEALDHNVIAKKNYNKICLEIGFGFGDFLFEKAKNNPDTFFLGSEPHLNGVVNLLSKLQKEPLQNIKISKEDIRILLTDFPSEFFDEIYILFPDPWPKLKHFKRRLINTNFLDFLSQKIKSQGKLIIATDHDSYKTWILSAISENKNFKWLAQSKKDWQKFPDWWIETKYQKKAALEGRASVIFNLIKNV
jgi:tRNA (guanine-N7-)-methyltransferase